jgi:hypothetical protein
MSDDADDLDDSFPPVSIRSVTLHVASPPVPGRAPTMPSAPSSSDDDPLLLRRLAATYEGTPSRSFAHADNGSMACTTHDANLRVPLADSPQYLSLRRWSARPHPGRCRFPPRPCCRSWNGRRPFVRICADVLQSHDSWHHCVSLRRAAPDSCLLDFFAETSGVSVC